MQHNDWTRETTIHFHAETEEPANNEVMNLEQECQLQQIRDDDT